MTHSALSANLLIQLEYLAIGGLILTDAIWPAIRKLDRLRSLCFHALTSFTDSVILSYVSGLQQSNYGMVLSFMYCTKLPSVAMDKKIKNMLDLRAKGRFETELARVGDTDTEFDSDLD